MSLAFARIFTILGISLIAVVSVCTPLFGGQPASQPPSGIPACSDSQSNLVHATALDPQMERGDKERERWNHVPDVLAALEITEGSSVADVGSGEGFFTLRLACGVGPSGRVYAIDIDKKALKILRARLRKGGFNNVQVIHSKPDGPKLASKSIDAALFVSSYHEMKFHQTVLERIRRALKPPGRLVIMEKLSYWESLPREDDPRDWQERRHDLDTKFVKQDLQESHYALISSQPARFRNVTEFSLTVARVAK